MTISEILEALKLIEQEHNAIEQRMNNIALLFCRPPTVLAVLDTDGISAEKLYDDLGLNYSIQCALEQIEQLISGIKILPDVPEKSILEARAGKVLFNIRSQVERVENLVNIIIKNGIPTPLWELSSELFELIRQSMVKEFCTATLQRTRMTSRNLSTLCFGSYLVFEKALRNDNTVIPYMSVVAIQEIDSKTGLASQPRVTISVNADNDPHRL
jgi:hypothetical protein